VAPGDCGLTESIATLVGSQIWGPRGIYKTTLMTSVGTNKMAGRPRNFVLVATWLGIYLFFFLRVNVYVLTGYMGRMDNPPRVFVVIKIVFLALIIWLLVGLAELRPHFIWISVAISAWSALTLAYGLVVLHLPDVAARGKTMVAVVMVLNAATAWYLASPEFRTRALQYRSERDRAKAGRSSHAAVQTSTRK